MSEPCGALSPQHQRPCRREGVHARHLAGHPPQEEEWPNAGVDVEEMAMGTPGRLRNITNRELLDDVQKVKDQRVHERARQSPHDEDVAYAEIGFLQNYLSDPVIDDMLVSEVRADLRSNIEVGTTCPACEQNVKVHRRKLNQGQAKNLLAIYVHAGTSWVHIHREMKLQSRDEAAMRFWGIIEGGSERREDGGSAGWWRVTERGERFLKGEIQIRKYARQYNREFYGFDGPWVSFEDCLGQPFDLREHQHRGGGRR